MIRLGTLLLAVTTISSISPAQDTVPYQTEIYAMASSLRGQNGIGEGGPSAAGFRVGGAWQPVSRLNFLIDVSHHFVADQNSSFTTIVAGPRIFSREAFRLSGFAQFLAGSQRATTGGSAVLREGWHLVAAPGAGLDIRLTDRFVLRPLELDLPVTQGLPLLRVSSGLAFRFGH
jgi:hypothetical protein